jgi:hypothetical protein
MVRIRGGGPFQTDKAWLDFHDNISELRDCYHVKDEALKPLEDVKAELEDYLNKCGIDPNKKLEGTRPKGIQPPDQGRG